MPPKRRFTTTWDFATIAAPCWTTLLRSLQTAIELQPDRKLYRDNLAAVLVDQGKVEEARCN